MSVKEMKKKDQLNNLSQNSTKDLSHYYTCRSCGMKFDNFGDMQKHILVEHMQKGDIPSEDSRQVREVK